MGRSQYEGTEPRGNWEAVQESPHRVIVEGSGVMPSPHHKPNF